MKEAVASPFCIVEEIGRAELPTDYGTFMIVAYRRSHDNEEAVALVSGDLDDREAVTVRIHSACLTGESFLSRRCDCREQLDFAMREIGQNGGVILYLFQEGRGIGIINKIRAYCLQDKGIDTVEANKMLGLEIDSRKYDLAAQILVQLGVKNVKLMTNNPLKIDGLSRGGIKVVERIPVVVDIHKEGARYIETKRSKMGHFL
jgi:3,4-dihydroxy 2-butanone 4-phosphate synthase/GTP cyclohydrolase II